MFWYFRRLIFTPFLYFFAAASNEGFGRLGKTHNTSFSPARCRITSCRLHSNYTSMVYSEFRIVDVIIIIINSSLQVSVDYVQISWYVLDEFNKTEEYVLCIKLKCLCLYWSMYCHLSHLSLQVSFRIGLNVDDIFMVDMKWCICFFDYIYYIQLINCNSVHSIVHWFTLC